MHLRFYFFVKGLGNQQNKKKNQTNQRGNLPKGERFDNDGRNSERRF